MKLSVKSDYAARAVLHLARYYQTGIAQRIDGMASEQGIPANYLVQILLELKSHGIVKSRRGKDGGYLLARPPAELSLADILECMHGQVFDSPALSDPHCPPELKSAWQTLQSTLSQSAASITFQNLTEEVQAKPKMYYI